MTIPVVALAQAEAEGCDGLAYKDEHAEITFAGYKMWWATMHQR